MVSREVIYKYGYRLVDNILIIALCEQINIGNLRIKSKTF